MFRCRHLAWIHDIPIGLPPILMGENAGFLYSTQVITTVIRFDREEMCRKIIVHEESSLYRIPGKELFALPESGVKMSL